jgi:Arc/MetJ-type ribon-helix-helix transcriptional regulator
MPIIISVYTSENNWYDDSVIPEAVKMKASKITITIDGKTLKELNSLVKSKVFPNRSRAIQEALEEKLVLLGKTCLAQECARLDPAFEQSLAEEGLTFEMEEWQVY